MKFLPFSRPSLGKEEFSEVLDSLKSGWITTGPKVQRFEAAFAKYADSPYAVAVNSGTAGLHIAYLALGIKPGDEVITTPLTFISTVSMILAAGAKPVLADIDPATLNIDCSQIRKKISKKTRAIVPVHFAGRPCDLDAIHFLAKKHRMMVVEDCAHALGTRYKGKIIGNLSDASVFSFHPIKNITTGEGGMVTTASKEWADEMTLLRFHGMSKSAWKRYSRSGTPHYDISRLGYKYNMLDLQAAIGLQQLKKLDTFNKVRERYARTYHQAFREIPEIFLQEIPDPSSGDTHSWHLYVIMLDLKNLNINRDDFIREMTAKNIGTGIHFTAVHRHSYYRSYFRRCGNGSLSNADFVSERICSLPLYPRMKEEDIDRVIGSVKTIIKKNRKRKWI